MLYMRPDPETIIISLVIPTLNEAESIPQVLKKIPFMDGLEVLVVDGGSNDGTVNLARSFGATVIQEQRKGYGQACATGLASAKGKIVVFMDGDGGDDPEYLAQIVAPLLENRADLVLGSRLAGKMDQGAMPWHQFLGNWISAKLIFLLYGIKLTDLSPFRAIKRSKFHELRMKEFTFGWPTEMITKAARLKWNIVEIPVSYHPRLGGKSKISGTLRGTILATFYILRTIIYYSRYSV